MFLVPLLHICCVFYRLKFHSFSAHPLHPAFPSSVPPHPPPPLSLSRPLIIVSQLEGPHRFVCSNEIDGEGMRRCRFKYSSAFRLSEELKKQNVVPPREM